MAKKSAKSNDSSFQNTGSAETGTFTKGLIRDYDENFDPESSWPYARNAVNNSLEGDVGLLGNEPSNYLCARTTFTIIGRIHLFNQYWVLFSTNNPVSKSSSEIGLYDEDLCTYRVIVNDTCLDFSTYNLVTGVSRETFDCSWNVYFADGKNPDRVINVGIPDLWPTSTYIGNNQYQGTPLILWPGVAWKQHCTPTPSVNGTCTICESINELNCDNIRLTKVVKTPCINVDSGQTGGNVYNGSYFAVIAYTINGQKYGDYTSPSNVQFIFNHSNIGGSLDITISDLETVTFTEFELVLVSNIDQVTTARKIGIYNTSNTVRVNLDMIDESLTVISLELIAIQNSFYETSDSMFQVANYLTRIGPRSTFDFNYQPLANQIQSKWVVAQHPANYYKTGGYVTGYMRDEVYAFWIRWIYVTGEKSSSYHIPGRVEIPGNNETTEFPAAGSTIYPPDPGGVIVAERKFEIENTATIDVAATAVYTTANLANASYGAEDGGILVAEGFMAYWESTEKYPDRMPEVWNVTGNPIAGSSNTNFDLCNKQIRHHKMPEDIIDSDASFTRATATGNSEATHINILGVKFNNIKPPVYLDESGVVRVIPGIVGYEILRGSREGNKTVIAKGIINNMREYPLASGGLGLYQNYPYNPVTNIYGAYMDPSLSTSSVDAGGGNLNRVTAREVRSNRFTFHSPDTSFYKPYLSVKELRLYTELGADNNVSGQFEEVPGHPKHKILTDFALIMSLLVGAAEASLVVAGQGTFTSDAPRILNLGLSGTILPIGPGPSTVPPATPSYFNAPDLNTVPPIPGAAQFSDTTALAIVAALSGTPTSALPLQGAANSFPTNLLGVNSALAYQAPLSAADSTLRGFIGSSLTYSQQEGRLSGLGPVAAAVAGVVTWGNFTNTAAANNIELIYTFIKYRQYALRYISHGILHRDNNGLIAPVNKRRYIFDAAYLTNNFGIFQNQRVNNQYRSSAVILGTFGNILNPLRSDNTICTIGNNPSGSGVDYNTPFETFTTTASCYYTGLKVRFRNQYGQLDSVEQIPIPCRVLVKDNNTFINSDINKPIDSPVLFGGDTYIGRYTEKNTFFYFSDWLYNQPDGTTFDYSNYYLGLYPRFWANFEKYDLDGLLGSIFGDLANPDQWDTPANLNNLDDGGSADPGFQFNINLRFSKKDAYMYLFQSAVRDFYVESEINVDQRDWGEQDDEKHYEVLSSLPQLFDTSIIKSGNYYKINPSLSIARLYNNIQSWGTMQARDYNPSVASLCYQYLPNRIIYSLPSDLENKKDYWRIFLTNNYRDFRSKVLAIRSIGKTGAMILFNNDSPLMFQGTETLETDINTKVTIGEGTLFNQPLQSIVNSDESYEYGSCQDKFSVLNTPVGIYWICQNQGKIFSMGGGLEEISGSGMRWWFGKFLPFKLVEDFPDFQLVDNPVSGIGCQAVYDNDFQLLYFCKKDYEVKKDLPAGITITYSGVGNIFSLNGSTKIFLGDPRYFNDVSWTISYDPKLKIWVSFHDWHPNFTFPSKLNFISTDGNRLWRHNDTSQSYCNFYGVDYPFQIEYVLDSGQQVDTLRNIEYLLESYVYDIDGIDRFHVLDYNFDELVVYNSEQVSGMLNLNLSPKNNPFARLNYPKVNINSIDVAYEKVEQKFRVNQFWDITADRGEYNTNVQRPIWLTAWDGYKKELNTANLNYNKSVFERKKFRHYYTNVLFTKRTSGNTKMLMKIANNKDFNSPR